MKLYGTITSERASKGQGGEYLRIDILNKNKKRVAILYVNALYKSITGIHLEYLPNEVQTTSQQTTLLEQKVVMIENCNGTGKHTSVQAIVDCPVCKNDPLLQAEKGEKQKGEYETCLFGWCEKHQVAHV